MRALRNSCSKNNFGVIFDNVITYEENEVDICSLGHFFLLLYRVNTINS